jgi:hypothetical protein
MTKTCVRCGQPKPLTGFPKRPKCHGGRGNTCHRCKDAGSVPAPSQPVPEPKLWIRELPRAQRYLVTAAQNATLVHGPFLESLKVAAQFLKAELVIIPLRYKNPTSRPEADKGDDWWDPAVEPYLFDGRVALNRNLTLVADVKNQPTATRPLTGFEALTGASSCIIGHPKMQFRTVAVPAGRYPKLMTTTGAVTERNYSDTRAGKLGEFHHFLGGLIVELEDDGGTFHLRQLNASRTTGTFIDLDLEFRPDGVFAAPPAQGLVMGDTHIRVMDPDVDIATFAKGGMVDTLNPRTLVFHDILDGETVNPHDRGNPFIANAKRRAGRLDVRAEMVEVVKFIDDRAWNRNVVIVDSNHHDFLARWLVAADWKTDLRNAEFYLETALDVLRSARMGPGGAEYDDPFPLVLRKLGLQANVRCLGPNDSFKIADVECGLHGHRGPNGAKGTLQNLSRMGTKTISGHSHGPGIEEGGYGVGTSSMRRLSYQKGPSSHLQTHCVVYGNGARALLTIVGGRYRLPPAQTESPAP